MFVAREPSEQKVEVRLDFSHKAIQRTGSVWRYRKGTNEVSNPVTFWRAGFNDSGWPTGTAPFHYGTNAIGGDDNVLTGTVLVDMRNGYRCVFLHRTFVITNVAEIVSTRLVTTYDDGFVAWVNGIEVARDRVNGQPAYTTNATSSHEGSPPTAQALALPS